MAPPIVNATIQSAALAAVSNLLAQTLMAYRQEVSRHARRHTATEYH